MNALSALSTTTVPLELALDSPILALMAPTAHKGQQHLFYVQLASIAE